MLHKTAAIFDTAVLQNSIFARAYFTGNITLC